MQVQLRDLLAGAHDAEHNFSVTECGIDGDVLGDFLANTLELWDDGCSRPAAFLRGVAVGVLAERQRLAREDWLLRRELPAC